jgi:DNA-binding XRE family transcriptional regulator
MRSKDRRGYRTCGLQLSNVEFSSPAEKRFVKKTIENLASRIAKRRREQGMSQERLAELANVSVSTIKFIEQNQRAPSLPLLLKLLFILDRHAEIWR